MFGLGVASFGSASPPPSVAEVILCADGVVCEPVIAMSTCQLELVIEVSFDVCMVQLLQMLRGILSSSLSPINVP